MVKDAQLESALILLFGLPLLAYGLIAANADDRRTMLIAAALLVLVSLARLVWGRQWNPHLLSPAKLAALLSACTAAFLALHAAGEVDAGTVGFLGVCWCVIAVMSSLPARRLVRA